MSTPEVISGAPLTCIGSNEGIGADLWSANDDQVEIQVARAKPSSNASDNQDEDEESHQDPVASSSMTRKHRRALIDSDSDEGGSDGHNETRGASAAESESSDKEEVSAKKVVRTKSRHRRFVMADDSDDERDRAEVHNGPSLSGVDSKLSSRDVDDSAMNSRPSGDSDDSRDEHKLYSSANPVSKHSDDDMGEAEIMEALKGDGKSKSTDKPKGNQRKKASEAMLEIRKESQRRVRESRLNLPYHRPKQFTLKAFLERKKQLKPLVDDLRPIDHGQLERLCSERERAIEEIYRSDSEDVKSDIPAPEDAECATNVVSVADLKVGPDQAGLKSLDSLMVETASDVTPHTDMTVPSDRIQRWLEDIPADDSAALQPLASSACDDFGEEKSACSESAVASYHDAPLESGEVKSKHTMADDSVEHVHAGESKRGDDCMSYSAEQMTPKLSDTGLSDVLIEQSVSNRNKDDARNEHLVQPASQSDQPSTSKASKLSNISSHLPHIAASLLNSTPILSRTSTVIDLDDDEEVQADTGAVSVVERFKERCVQHAIGPSSRRAADERRSSQVSVGVVRFETDETGRQQLVSDSLQVTVDASGDGVPTSATPGAGRQALRGQLLDNIRRQREEARQRREKEAAERHARDRAQSGDLASEEDVFSDEEALLSSSAQESEPEEEDDVVLRDAPRHRSDFVDDQAEESDDAGASSSLPDHEREQNEADDASEDLPDLEVMSDRVDSASVAANNAQDDDTYDGGIKLFLDEESRPESDSFSLGPFASASDLFCGQKTPASSQMASTGAAPSSSTLSVTQPASQMSDSGGVDELRRGNSPDAAGRLSPPCGSDLSALLGPLCFSPVGVSQPTHTARATAAAGKPSAIGALLDPPDATRDSQEDLLSLCSGKFDWPSRRVATRQPSRATAAMTYSKNDRQMTPSSVSALLLDDGNACMPLELSPVRRPTDARDDAATEDSQASDDVGVPAVRARRKRKRRTRLVFSDEERDSDAEDNAAAAAMASDQTDDVEDEVDDPLERRLKSNFSYLFTKKNSNNNRSAGAASPAHSDSDAASENNGVVGRGGGGFLDDEAELSGSEEPSDDEDDGEELDVMDEELADAENLDEDQLREQVERMHYKKALDEDLHELKLFQQRFLDDGDLHGPGRERKFRWSNQDDVGFDLPLASQGVEDTAEEDDLDEKWRLERHEREKWLQQHRDSTDAAADDADDSSQSCDVTEFSFLKPVRTVIKKTATTPESRLSSTNKLTPSSKCRARKMARGSFLPRDHGTLCRLTGLARPGTSVGTTAAGARGSSSRTFSLLSNSDDVTPQSADDDRSRQSERASQTSHASDAAPSKRRRSAVTGDGRETKRPHVQRSLSLRDKSASLFNIVT